jgi:hypothetical protein
MSDADNLRSQIERAKRFAASMTSEAERNRFEAIASDLRRELQLVEVRGAAMVAAFQVLASCLEKNEAIHPGEFPEGLYGDDKKQAGRHQRYDVNGAPRHSDGDTGLVYRHRPNLSSHSSEV